MEIEKAKGIGLSVLKEISPFIDNAYVAGSIRRNKPKVNDIDLVILPKDEFMVMEQIKAILKKFGKFSMEGDQIIRIETASKITIDCYVAKPQNYEVLVLIRTGSAEHNKKLAIEAKRQGMSLKFSEGLIDQKTGKVVANTEKSIFEALKMEYKEPQER